MKVRLMLVIPFLFIAHSLADGETLNGCKVGLFLGGVLPAGELNEKNGIKFTFGGKAKWEFNETMGLRSALGGFLLTDISDEVGGVIALKPNYFYKKYFDNIILHSITLGIGPNILWASSSSKSSWPVGAHFDIEIGNGVGEKGWGFNISYNRFFSRDDWSAFIPGEEGVIHYVEGYFVFYLI